MKGAKELTEDLRAAAGQLLDGSSAFVLEVRVTPGKTTRIRVIVDGDTGVTIDDCARISRELNQRMEGLGLSGDYNLEVTTPGVDQPLRVMRQFPKHIGRNLRLVTKEGREMKGKLLEVSAEGLRLVPEPAKAARKTGPDPEPVGVPFSDIEKAFVLISFK